MANPYRARAEERAHRDDVHTHTHNDAPRCSVIGHVAIPAGKFDYNYDEYFAYEIIIFMYFRLVEIMVVFWETKLHPNFLHKMRLIPIPLSDSLRYESVPF